VNLVLERAGKLAAAVPGDGSGGLEVGRGPVTIGFAVVTFIIDIIVCFQLERHLSSIL